MHKKVGILTFHQALSYGAKLQAYALQQFLDENGVENDIIDYTCRFMYTRLIRPIRVGKKHKVKSFIRSLITMRQVGIDRRKSAEFCQKHMRLSRPFTEKTIAEAASEYRAFIAGSDQIWSPTCVGFDPVYFLTFAKPWQKYSYAASIAEKRLPDDLLEEYRRRLGDFVGISVREKSGADIIFDLLNRSASVNADPTLLIESGKWRTMSKRTIEQPYIFLFNVKRPLHLVEYAKKLAKKTGLKIYYLQKNRFPRVKGVTYLDPVSADEFLGLIENASYVCTNSFHATVFSVLFKKAFAVEYDNRDGRNIRSEELLNYLGITDREIKADVFPDPESYVDWACVEERLAVQRRLSKEYIEKIKNDILKGSAD